MNKEISTNDYQKFGVVVLRLLYWIPLQSVEENSSNLSVVLKLKREVVTILQKF